MDFSTVKRVIYDLLSYFRIEENEQLLFFKESRYAGTVGSAVDPQPVDVNVLKDLGASEGSGQDGQVKDEDVGATASASAADIPLPKSLPCSSALSQDISTALENGSGEDESTQTKVSQSAEIEEFTQYPMQRNQFSDATPQCNDQDHSAACTTETGKENEETRHSVAINSNSIHHAMASADSNTLVPAIPSTNFLGSQCSDAFACVTTIISPPSCQLQE